MEEKRTTKHLLVCTYTILLYLNVCIINFQITQQYGIDPIFATIHWHSTKIHADRPSAALRNNKVCLNVQLLLSKNKKHCAEIDGWIKYRRKLQMSLIEGKSPQTSQTHIPQSSLSPSSFFGLCVSV